MRAYLILFLILSTLAFRVGNAAESTQMSADVETVSSASPEEKYKSPKESKTKENSEVENNTKNNKSQILTTAPVLMTAVWIPMTPAELEYEKITKKAAEVIGKQNGVSLKLIKLPTTEKNYSRIVDINGFAVVVVDYNGHRLPYYMNPLTMRWEPLLGIGVNGGWFNVYPADSISDIPVIESISNHLLKKLTPADILHHIGKSDDRPMFPMPSTAAYRTINAEFPNGVVNTNTGAMSSSDQQLYNNNYQLIQQKLQ